MNNEIKEILEELKEKNERYKECSENGIIENDYYKSHILLDYITNLQEENDYFNKKNIELSTLNTSLRSDRDDYKSMIDKALDKLYCYGEVLDRKILQQFQKEIENILQGSDIE